MALCKVWNIVARNLVIVTIVEYAKRVPVKTVTQHLSLSGQELGLGWGTVVQGPAGGQALSYTSFPSAKSLLGEIPRALAVNGCHVCVEMVSMFRMLFKDRFDLNVLPAFVSPEKYSFQQTLLQTHLPCSQLAFPCTSTNIFNCSLPLIDQLTQRMPAACSAWECAACVQRQEWWLADGQVSDFRHEAAFDEALG